MFATLKGFRYWLLAWAVLSLLGSTWIARNELARQQDAFDTNARIVHRLLSQQVVQHDAILATLALLHSGTAADRPEQRLPALYTQIAAAAHRGPGEVWPTLTLAAAEAESTQLKRAVLADVDLKKGTYQLVLAAQPDSYALTIAIRNMVPWTEWPMAPDTSPVHVRLQLAQSSYLVQAGRAFAPGDAGWTFAARKVLAAESQPFEVVSELHLGWSALPWLYMLLSAGFIALVLLRGRMLVQQRVQQRREEERQRVGQLTRLNTLGELAAGMAHEINQPLTAILANTQAASRMLDESEPDLAVARGAMQMAVQQARRASDVVGRLRRTVERPGSGTVVQSINLIDACRHALYLLEPELQRSQCTHTLVMESAPFAVQADPVALEQIIHNLLTNALQAMEQIPQPKRLLKLVLHVTANHGVLQVQDSGPGIAADALPKVFEPFFSTREDGLGLGHPNCSMTTPLAPLSPLIHLIDDDEAVRSSLALLISTVGLRVQPWADPHTFLQSFDRESIGAIVLDTLKEQKVDQPVIMLTGHGTIDMCRRAFKSGAAEFLEKPVDDERLLEALQTAVRQHVQSRQRNQADRSVSRPVPLKPTAPTCLPSWRLMHWPSWCASTPLWWTKTPPPDSVVLRRRGRSGTHRQIAPEFLQYLHG